MAKEIELKLAIPLQAGKALRQHEVLGLAVSFDSKHLQNIYFDTPSLDLNKSRVALRIRQVDERYIQTLKTSGSSSGGLHERGEWEWDVNGPALDLSLIDADLLPEALDLEYLRQHLQPAFETNFQRDRWLLNVSHEHLKAEIELVHDQGQVLAQGKTDPISEIELELKSGDADLLFKVAHDLSGTVPLLISNISKGQRGFRLFAPEYAGLSAPTTPAFNDRHGLVLAAQNELDRFIAARDQIAFSRNWSELETLYSSLRQLRWCLLHLSRLTLPSALYLPTVLRYKLRMFSYSLEHLVTLYQQQNAWERLDHCPTALRNSADFVQLNEHYQPLMSASWIGQTLIEVMQWLYLLNRDSESMPFVDKKAIFVDKDATFEALLNQVHLPRHPTDKVLWLRQQAPLLHLSRWLEYQFSEPSLGEKNLLKESLALQRKISELSGLMAEEITLWQLSQQQADGIDNKLIKRNQDDQYEMVLALGRQALSFNSLQQNLQRLS